MTGLIVVVAAFGGIAWFLLVSILDLMQQINAQIAFVILYLQRKDPSFEVELRQDGVELTAPFGESR